MRKAYIQPTKSALIIGIIVMAIFLIFGISFLVVLHQEGSEIGQGFMLFWILIVLIIGGSFIYNYRNFDKNEPITGSVIDYPDTNTLKNTEPPFDEKRQKF